MNAILKYPGGKWRIASWIISHFPAHKVYCEPYFGSGAVFFCKPPSRIETINDLNGDIVNLFRICRERPAELAALIELTPFSREEYIDCAQQSPSPLERARRTVVRYWQSWGASNSSLRSWRNSQAASSPRVCAEWRQLPQKVLNVCARLKDAQIENCDALTLISRYNSPETLLYIDPPYLRSIRKKNIYKNEMNDAQHVELLRLLKDSSSKIVLSAYDNKIYNAELQDWYTTEKTTQAQMGLIRTEKLYMNFPPAVEQMTLLN